MKTTRKKLLKIIKEELNKVLEVDYGGDTKTIFSDFLDELEVLSKKTKRTEPIIAFERDIGMSWGEYLKGVGEYVVERVQGNRPGVLGYGSEFLEGAEFGQAKLPDELPWWVLTDYFGKPEESWNSKQHEGLLGDLSWRWINIPIKA